MKIFKNKSLQIFLYFLYCNLFVNFFLKLLILIFISHKSTYASMHCTEYWLVVTYIHYIYIVHKEYNIHDINYVFATMLHIQNNYNIHKRSHPLTKQ